MDPICTKGGHFKKIFMVLNHQMPVLPLYRNQSNDLQISFYMRATLTFNGLCELNDFDFPLKCY